MSDTKKESSVTGGIKGTQAPGSTPMVRRDRDSFEESMTIAALNDESLHETVKKRGEQWVVFDDKTGVEKGVFSDREQAWKKQRQMRQSQKGKKKPKHGSTFKKHRKKKNAAKLAPKAHTAPKAHLAPKSQKEHLLAMFKESVKRVLINEGSALSYVFEQAPLENDSKIWEAFLEKISKQTLLSDPKLLALLKAMAKNEVKSLGNAVNAIKKNLEKTGNFEVEQKKPDQDKEGDLFLNFQIKMVNGGKNLDFSVKLEHGKPLIQIPEQTRANLNSMATPDSKFLRSELIHIQETILNNMNEVIETTEKRDEYLGKLHADAQKSLSNMSPLQIVMLRYLLKSKYKSVK